MNGAKHRVILKNIACAKYFNLSDIYFPAGQMAPATTKTKSWTSEVNKIKENIKLNDKDKHSTM